MCTIEDLAKFEWLGDRDLHTFRHRWSMIVEGFTDNLREDTLASVLAKKLEQSGELREDIAYNYRCLDGHRGHTYTRLRDAMDRRLSRRQQKKNREGQTREWATRPKDVAYPRRLRLTPRPAPYAARVEV